MSDPKRDRSVLNPKARGGDTAEGGFAFQDAFIVSMIPAWLADPRFTKMIRESLGDVEAIFFDPEKGERIAFTEFKNDYLTPVPFWKEVARFRELAEGAKTFDRFALVCRGVSEQLAALVKQLRRVRETVPFYEMESVVQEESHQDLVESIEKAGGEKGDTGLLLGKADVDFEAPDAEGLQEALFAERLGAVFPETQDASGSKVKSAHAALTKLVASRRGRTVHRSELERALWDSLPEEVRPASMKRLSICTEHEVCARAAMGHEVRSVPLRWARFFGGEDRNFPDPSEWEELVAQATKLRKWVDCEERPRRLVVTGHRRLSSSVALGSVFSAVAGFTLEVDFRGAPWCSDDHPAPGDTVDWGVSKHREASSSAVAVSIGLPRSIAADVESHLASSELESVPHLALHYGSPLPTAREANAAVATAKENVSLFLQETGATSIKLFVAVPSPFALFFGHRLNATAYVQCHEFHSERRYVETCTLKLS